MDRVLERISVWEASGLIDPATAARLRLAEAETPPEDSAATQAADPSAAVESGPRRGPSSVASVFGPGVTIGEMFAYLGGAFLLGAYESFVLRAAGPGEGVQSRIALGAVGAAVAFIVLGWLLRNGDARRRRAAGVMFALAVVHVGAAGFAYADAMGIAWPGSSVIAALLATLVAIALRLLHASLLTQFALLASGTTFAAVLLEWLRSIVFPAPAFDHLGELPAPGGPDPLLLVLVSAIWWLGFAIIVGLAGLAEARTVGDELAAGRRAALTRLWAGLVAVIGFAASVTRSEYGADGAYVRVIPPWLGDLAILALAAILVERAFRRDASTFVYAAALGMMIALTDFNYTYLSASTEIGLLIEGLILLVAGVAADRLRRRIGQLQPGDDMEIVTPAAPAAPA